MTKKEKLINLIEKQTNIKLSNEDYILNKKRNWLYTYIKPKDKLTLMMFFEKYNIQHEEHTKGFYWLDCSQM